MPDLLPAVPLNGDSKELPAPAPVVVWHLVELVERARSETEVRGRVRRSVREEVVREAIVGVFN
jgi:hypothetical protein